MAICDWPQLERPREKLLNQGASTLSDAELLAIFLRTGVKGKTAVDLGHQLIKQFGDLRELMEADLYEFCQQPGLGLTKYVQLKASLELSRRYLMTRIQYGNAIKDSLQVKNYLLSRLDKHKSEVFACLFLNSRHQVIAYKELFYGSINAVMIYPRIIIEHAFDHGAAGVILAHNHPSGDPTPSEEDKKITARLEPVLKAVEICLLDHFVIGNGQALSFAEIGLLT